jgi:hypothetical protein
MNQFSLQSSSGLFITRKQNIKAGQWPTVSAGLNGGKASPEGQFAFIERAITGSKCQYVIQYGNSPQMALTVPGTAGKSGEVLAWEPADLNSPAQRFTFLASPSQPAGLNRVRLYSCYSQMAASPIATNDLSVTAMNGSAAQDWILSPSNGAKIVVEEAANNVGSGTITFQASGLQANTQYIARFMGIPGLPLDNSFCPSAAEELGFRSDAKGNLNGSIVMPVEAATTVTNDPNGFTTMVLEVDSTTSYADAFAAISNRVFYFK